MINALGAQDTIITANKRQALALQSEYLQQKPSSLAPNIIDYQSFLIQQWQKIGLSNHSTLLDKTQQFFLWANIVRHPNQLTKQQINLRHFLKKDRQFISTVLSEYGLVRQFHIPITCLNTHFSSKSKLLGIWIQGYQKFLKKNQCIDEFYLPDLIIKDPIRSPIFYYGFKQTTPEQSCLFKALFAQPLIINTIAKTPNVNQAFQTTDDELIAVANWAKQQHEHNIIQSIAIVVPDLTQLRHRIVFNMDKVFGYHRILTPGVNKAYNLSLGKPLSQYPLISHGVQLLSFSRAWQGGKIDQKLLSIVLTSPFILGYKIELNQRFMADVLLKNLEQYQLTPPQIIHMLKIANCKIMLSLLDTLTPLLDGLVVTGFQQSHSAWMGVFSRLLTHYGWCVDKSLLSVQHQLLNKYQSAVLSFYRLDVINQSLSFAIALSNWQQLLNLINFQPKLTHQVNIHILGQLEAQDLLFDKIWIMGANHQFLPGKIKQFRFIDPDIAQQFFLPNNNYKQLAQQANITLKNLTKIAPITYFSYAKADKSLMYFPTPMLKFKMVSASKILPKIAFKTLEKRLDTRSHVIDNKHINQGVKTLADQAQCAFKGFSHRLNIPDMSTLSMGINAKNKGILIHKILNKFWQSIQNQNILKQKKAKIPYLINQQVKQFFPKECTMFDVIEINRITMILLNFLDKELTRDYFEIKALESKQTVNINGLIFDICLDRVDEDKFGNQSIFDYKTGQVSMSKLGITKKGLTGIISEPQLAIYALHNQANGIIFIQLCANDIKYIGYSDHENMVNLLGKKNTDNDFFLQLKQYWKSQLNKTGFDFQQGIAEVLPTKNACNYCQLSPLCRVII